MHEIEALTSAIGRTTLDGVEHEVFAEARATYEPGTRELTISLDSYLRPDDAARLGERVTAPWLPASQSDREHVDEDEASALARDVFHRWCSKVQHHIPR
jgi:hypothetical protein